MHHESAHGIEIRDLRKTFRSPPVVACDNVTLNIPKGELLVLLGPSGCGKSTTLRCVAGLESPDNEGAIFVEGRELTHVAPKDRNLAFVFQQTALFPNLNVRRNISFGLDMRKKLDKAEIRRRVAEAASMLRIDELLDRYPGQLSGGQAQRVALGRAIVTDPLAFLLDEPFASLDAALRVEMRTEIKLIQRRMGATMIFVTHDQEEALVLGDQIAVMNEGRVQQVGTPEEIYDRPANLFVATFIGSPRTNVLEGVLSRNDVRISFTSGDLDLFLEEVAEDVIGRQVYLTFRPEYVTLVPETGAAGRGTIKLIELHGSQSLITLEVAGRIEIRALVQGKSSLKEGDVVGYKPDYSRVILFSEGGALL